MIVINSRFSEVFPQLYSQGFNQSFDWLARRKAFEIQDAMNQEAERRRNEEWTRRSTIERGWENEDWTRDRRARMEDLESVNDRYLEQTRLREEGRAAADTRNKFSQGVSGVFNAAKDAVGGVFGAYEARANDARDQRNKIELERVKAGLRPPTASSGGARGFTTDEQLLRDEVSSLDRQIQSAQDHLRNFISKGDMGDPLQSQDLVDDKTELGSIRAQFQAEIASLKKQREDMAKALKESVSARQASPTANPMMSGENPVGVGGRTFRPGRATTFPQQVVTQTPPPPPPPQIDMGMGQPAYGGQDYGVGGDNPAFAADPAQQIEQNFNAGVAEMSAAYRQASAMGQDPVMAIRSILRRGGFENFVVTYDTADGRLYLVSKDERIVIPL